MATEKIESRGLPVRIAVIGGGPKAAALAAKAWVLRDQQIADIRVTIFEPAAIGAEWSGKCGYTDGEQRLCTIAERDVAYPYNSMLGRQVDAAMASKFSWGSSCIPDRPVIQAASVPGSMPGANRPRHTV
jgi:mycobactin lysine-N-oxygenase